MNLKPSLIVGSLFIVILISGCVQDGETFTILGWKPDTITENQITFNNVSVPLDEEEVCTIVNQLMNTSTCRNVVKANEILGTWKAYCCWIDGMSPNVITINEMLKIIQIAPGM